MPKRNLPRVPERRRDAASRVADFCEVALPYTREEAQQEALRCLRCRRAPCTVVCPLGTRADLYVPLIAEGRLAEAAAILRETDPFPGICARVCHRPCEDVCLAGKVDGPIAIRSLKRFLVDVAAPALAAPTAAVEPPALAFASVTGADVADVAGAAVAVVGSGPAGLTAARELARLGHAVTVFEALDEPGGLLRWGIPAYRLPRETVAAAVHEVEAEGVTLRTGVRVGRDVSLDELAATHGAVLLAIGAHQSRSLDVPGEEHLWVMRGLDFLRAVAVERTAPLRGPAVVIGGGDAALDAARSARRLGAAPVTIVYRRSRAEMPARAEEIHEAEEEGIHFRFLAAPLAIHEDADGGRRVTFQAMRLEPAPGGGRPVPRPIPGDCWYLPADTVIAAVGQIPDATALPPVLRDAMRDSTLTVDPDTLATSLPGVFACGDAVGGKANVTDAAAAGRRAAAAIHAYLADRSALAGSVDEPVSAVDDHVLAVGD